MDDRQDASLTTIARDALVGLCDGLCVTGADIGVPGPGVAYAHPGCPEHAPGAVCECGSPDDCLSPTHGQITLGEALAIRHRQRMQRP